jgi:hypothetical protein
MMVTTLGIILFTLYLIFTDFDTAEWILFKISYPDIVKLPKLLLKAMPLQPDLKIIEK